MLGYSGLTGPRPVPHWLPGPRSRARLAPETPSARLAGADAEVAQREQAD